MNIATILFTYNRSKHTKAVLDALANNRILPEKLFIFQDGMKASTNKEEWNAVGRVITSVSWCDTEIFISEKNKGLANSIVAGVNQVFESFDAVIVLEDDCVPHPQFMEYMVKALEKYKNCQEVYHIGASSEPVDAVPNGTDAYFLGRINSCGWGTWKERWQKFTNDYTIVGKIKADSQLNERLMLWGENLEATVVSNIYGRTDSWACFWALSVIMNKGYCMSPYESLINNIGFDGTGVHSGIAKSTLKLRTNERLSEIVLPDKVEWVEGYQKSFAHYYPWVSPAVKNEYYKNVAFDLLELQKNRRRITDWLIARNIFNIMLWGKGKVCDYLINEFDGQIAIDAIVETTPKEDRYRNIPVIRWDNIPVDTSLVLVIPGYDITRIRNMIDNERLMKRIMPIDQLINKIKS